MAYTFVEKWGIVGLQVKELTMQVVLFVARIQWVAVLIKNRKKGDTVARTGKTNTKGGQCVAYAANYFGKRFGVDYASEIWEASTVTQRSTPKTGCCAVWTGGKNGSGHVGVVESWSSSKETMTFSDSNFDGDEMVYRNIGISEDTMEGYFGDTYTFMGYVEFK